MKLLGKIGLIFICLVYTYGAKLTLSNSQIIPGEEVSFQISATGKNIAFPDINKIDSYKVMKTGSGINTVVINGSITTEKTQGYVFSPTSDVTIPAFIVKVDGKEEYTKQTKINIISQSQMQSKPPFHITMDVDNKSPYVGQMIQLHVTIKIDERLSIGDLQMGIDGLDNFWNKDKPSQTQSNENGYKILKANYWLSPLKDGNLTLGPATVRVGIRSRSSGQFNSFFERMNYKTFSTKPIPLHVKPLPSGAKVSGDFTIEAVADKKDVEAGKPVNVTIQIKGNGNLDELESLKNEIQNVVIYDDKPSIKSGSVGGTYESSWRQKLAYIGSNDFTIPPFSLTFFDTKSGKIKTIKTNSILVHVKGNVAKSVESKSEIIAPTKTKVIVKKVDTNWLYIALSFVCGIILGWIVSKVNFKILSPKKARIFKNEKEILQEILPLHGKDKKLDSWIIKLEENIYQNKNHKIDKKEISNFLKGVF